jgi:hypothetical protein
MTRRRITKSVPKVVKKTLNTALTNKFVLYFVCFLAVFNVIGYLNLQNFDAIIFFILVAVLTKCFTKNMIIILLTAMIGTSILNSARNKRYGIIEGLDGLDDSKVEEAKRMAAEKAKGGAAEEANGMAARAAADTTTVGTGGDRINRDETTDAATSAAGKALSPERIQALSQDTKNLKDQQANLAETMQALQPMVVQANSMMDSLDTNKISNLLDVFNKFKGVGGGSKASPHSPGANSFKTV